MRILKNLVDDLVVLVTGAAGGMGSKAAEGFAGCGANVLASNIDR